MSTFVYLINTPGPHYHHIDTDFVNEILTKLQQRGAKITSVTASMSHTSGGDSYVLYVIAYEAPGPISP